MREVIVESFDECTKLLKLGEMNRSYAETKMNHTSSRSHTLFRVTVQSVIRFEPTVDESGGAGSLERLASITSAVNVQAVLNFIDLAGSERTDMSEGKRKSSPGGGGFGERRQVQKEGQHINKSLFFLTQVIAMRASGTSDHIPYRNSPLTKILKVSLGGNSRTAIILCITPSMRQVEQTSMTLRFGQNAKKIKNRVSANMETDVTQKQMMIKQLIAQYKDKMSQMEKKKNEDDSGDESDINDEAMARLQAIIRSLEAEKNLLNKRLTDANYSNLDRMTADENGLVAGKVIERYFHMPDTGLVWSSQELTPALKQQYPDPRTQAFSSIYVTDFESDITSQQNMVEMLKPLREAQEEIAEMRQANDNLIEKVSELEGREVSLELEKTKL